MVNSPGMAGRVWLPVLLAAVLVALYSRSVNHPFMLHDYVGVVDHADVVEPSGLRDLWLHDRWLGRMPGAPAYQPVAVASLNLNARLGMSPPTFRVVNLALLWAIGLATAAWLHGYTKPVVAWLCGLLVVAHPVHHELVHHLVGRSDLLAMLGVLLFAVLQKRAIDAERWSPAAALAALLMAGVAVGSKCTGLMVLPLAIAQAWVTESQRHRDAVVRWRLHAQSLLLVAAPVIVYALARQAAVGWTTGDATTSADITANPMTGAPFAERLPAAVALAWFYFKQTFFPSLAFNHTPAAMPSWGHADTLRGALVLAVFLGVAVFCVARRRWAVLATVLSLSQYLLVSNLVIPSAVYASNLLTLPFTLGAVMLLASRLDSPARRSLRNQAIAVIPCVAMLVAMSVGVLVAGERWASVGRVAAGDAATQVHNPVAAYNYGSALMQAGRYDEAIHWLNWTLDLRPGSIEARHALAQAEQVLGELAGARATYREILDRSPRDRDAHAALASIALTTNDLNAARQHIEDLAELAPQDGRVMELRQRLREQQQ